MAHGFVTIHDLVERQALEGAQLIAGFSGENNPVTWVNIMEILDEPDSLQKGELLITTGYQFEDEARYGGLVAELKQRDVSGIAIQLGYYIDKVPDYMRRAADREGLPVLIIPAHLTFSAILHILMEEIRQPPQKPEDRNMEQLLSLLETQLSHEDLLQEGEKWYLFVATPAHDDLGGLQAVQDGSTRIRSYLRSQSVRCIQVGLPNGLMAFSLTFAPTNAVSDVIFELTILLTFLSEQEYVNFYIGVESLDRMDRLAESFHSAGKCCETLRSIGAKRGVCRSQNLPFFFLFNNINRINREAVQGKYGELHTLLDYDRVHNTNYVYTLRVYLAQEDSPSKTAARLFIHRHTLYKRLEKISEICGWDLSDYYTRTYLSVCLMLHDYYAL